MNVSTFVQTLVVCALISILTSCDGSSQKLPIGSPCAMSSECGDQPFFCAKAGHPGGYCKKTCKADSACPSESICVLEGDEGECHKKCDATATCRDGYECKPAEDTVDAKASHAFCDPEDTTPMVAHSVFVASDGVLEAYDLATGMQRSGSITNVTGPVDMQALADGTVLVNLTGRNEVLAFSAVTMLETARIPSSAIGGTRPVHSYISPERGAKQYWITLNDGDGTAPTNSARFIDVTKGSADYLKPAGEVALGIGHHKASFSSTTSRVVISNIGDCNNVLSVYDYSDVANIKTLATLTAAQAGWNGSSFPKTCDPTYANGVPPAPHGCATSKVSKHAYCNLTSSGQVVDVDIDATPPTFKFLTTQGSGGGYTKTTLDGKYVFSLQEKPREADPMMAGAICQAGQLVVIEATAGTVVKQLPLLYGGAACTTSIAGGDEKTVNPGHMLLSTDGKTLYVNMGGGFGVADARARKEVIVDITDPGNPVQKASVPTGTSTGHHGDAISGDGKWLFTADNIDNTITQIDTATNTVTRTIKTAMTPSTLSTFGSAAGPAAQTGPIH